MTPAAAAGQNRGVCSAVALEDGTPMKTAASAAIPRPSHISCSTESFRALGLTFISDLSVWGGEERLTAAPSVPAAKTPGGSAPR
ncbi:hypothetical protein GCM10011359_04760 [Nesterenkonia alkaliphila]|nr:hypothetical protein GCM10011359_04760 [Nesterenkonia alkaliphila]